MPTKIEIKYNQEKKQNDPAGTKNAIFLFRKLMVSLGISSNTRVKPFLVKRTFKRQQNEFKRKVTISRNQRKQRRS